MTLLTAFDVLLGRLSGQEDVVVGCPIAGRTHRELENVVGFFVNTLALRTDLSGEPTFMQLLARVRETTLGAYAHQDLPFEKLVEELRPSRSLSHSSLFQVLFALQNAPRCPLEFPNLVVSPIHIEEGTAKFDLSLMLFEEGEALCGWVEYATDLFDAATIERMIDHFRTLLGGIVAAPQQRITELPLLSEPDRSKILVEWNRTETDYPDSACLHELFEEQVERTPDAVALVCGSQRLTYRELNRGANQVAHYLRGLGVGPEILVALCLERSAELVVGLLGILKAGGAYLPVDLTDPCIRIRSMFEEANVNVVLTRSSLARDPRLTGKTLVHLDAKSTFNDQPTTNLALRSEADQLAYVMYTSGTTHKPKGVAVEHRGVVRLLFGVDYVPFHEKQTFLQLAPITFDASTLELWGPLLHGGTCVLFTDRIPCPEELRRALTEYPVRCLWLTAALFNAIIDREPQVLSSVRYLLIGGEALSVHHVRRALEQLPDTRIINGYGPTEGTTFSCCYPIPRRLAPDLHSIPIGRPIGNTRVYVLDAWQHPVPVGVAGELYIGGAGLARGYLHCPVLTAEKFVPNPFGDASSRLYRTGDRVRWRSDGNLEFLGRLDRQIKVRGFRIEPGEVESALTEHADVAEAVVLPREDRTGEHCLVAYLVLVRGATTSATDEIREHVSRLLPAYMVPSAFVVLHRLPLTANGKVDRAALPAPRAEREESARGYLAPRSQAEQALAAIWAQVLGLERVGVEDNFFELGGHSLLAIRLFAAIEAELGKRLPLAALFEGPSIARLAELLSRDGWVPPWSPLVPIQPEGSRPPLFCIHGGGSQVLIYRNLAVRLGREQPLYGLQPVGLDGRQPGLERVEDMAATYLQAIRTRQPCGPYYLAGLSFGGVVAFEMAQQLRAQGQEVALLALFDTQLEASLADLESARRRSLLERAWQPVRELFLKARFHYTRPGPAVAFGEGVLHPQVCVSSGHRTAASAWGSGLACGAGPGQREDLASVSGLFSKGISGTNHAFSRVQSMLS